MFRILIDSKNNEDASNMKQKWKTKASDESILLRFEILQCVGFDAAKSLHGLSIHDSKGNCSTFNI
ncbi:hypothetical protein T03_13461 [Trichinella britovi]|uniref:Uncharacterized protein n=1 Tax=Trichinella britovi TaxID=45882 RepID=A0A0V1CNX2_TRIBR|nr:hypothetical protein T03_13461 [Trichinella britovi]